MHIHIRTHCKVRVNIRMSFGHFWTALTLTAFQTLGEALSLFIPVLIFAVKHRSKGLVCCICTCGVVMHACMYSIRCTHLLHNILSSDAKSKFCASIDHS